jgi:hypothetical protein
MTIKELFEVALTVMGSLGGGGAIVFAFSHLLGRLWADRALEEHRHKFNQLNQQMQHDLDFGDSSGTGRAGCPNSGSQSQDDGRVLWSDHKSLTTNLRKKGWTTTEI